MRVPLALPILLATALVAEAGDITKLDAPAKAEWRVIVADPVITTLTIDGNKPARWVLVDEHPAAELRPSGDGKTADFAALVDGHFRVLAFTDNDVFRVKVVKGKPEPMPDPNKPPVPPTPPPPNPPPAPVDPVVAVFAAAYRLDPRDAAVKGEELKTLAALYEAAAELPYERAEPQPGQKAEDMSFTINTAADLVARVKKASESKQLKVAGLLDLRKTIAAEIKAVFPEDVVLNAESRKKAADLFMRIKSALEQVK